MRTGGSGKGPVAGRIAKARRSFREWRRSRPLSAGVFTMLSGLIILFPPYASLKFDDVVISMNTVGGISSLLIGVVMVMCAISLWVAPRYRLPVGIIIFLLALVAIVAANLGVFMVGTLLGLVGAALAIAWSAKPVAAPAVAVSDVQVIGGEER
jgi:hypothetical protein